jgi:hypothetical protein
MRWQAHCAARGSSAASAARMARTSAPTDNDGGSATDSIASLVL